MIGYLGSYHPHDYSNCLETFIMVMISKGVAFLPPLSSLIGLVLFTPIGSNIRDWRESPLNVCFAGFVHCMTFSQASKANSSIRGLRNEEMVDDEEMNGTRSRERYMGMGDDKCA